MKNKLFVGLVLFASNVIVAGDYPDTEINKLAAQVYLKLGERDVSTPFKDEEEKLLYYLALTASIGLQEEAAQIRSKFRELKNTGPNSNE